MSARIKQRLLRLLIATVAAVIVALLVLVNPLNFTCKSKGSLNAVLGKDHSARTIVFDGRSNPRLDQYSIEILEGECFPRLFINGYAPPDKISELYDICGGTSSDPQKLFMCLNEYLYSNFKHVDSSEVDNHFCADPLQSLNFYGYSSCLARTMMLCSLVGNSRPDLNVRMLKREAHPIHVICEIEYEGGWHAFDPEYGLVFPDAAHKGITNYGSADFTAFVETLPGWITRKRYSDMENIGLSDRNIKETIDFSDLRPGDILIVDTNFDPGIMGARATLRRRILNPGERIELRLPYPLIELNVVSDSAVRIMMDMWGGEIDLIPDRVSKITPSSKAERRSSPHRDFIIQFDPTPPKEIEIEAVMRLNPFTLPSLCGAMNEVEVDCGDLPWKIKLDMNYTLERRWTLLSESGHLLPK